MRKQSGIHEHCRRPQRIAERALAWPSRWVSRSSCPPPAHPLIQRDQILRRLGERLRHQQQAAQPQFRRIGHADRDDAVAGFQAPGAPAIRFPAARNPRRTTAASSLEEQKRPLLGWPRRRHPPRPNATVNTIIASDRSGEHQRGARAPLKSFALVCAVVRRCRNRRAQLRARLKARSARWMRACSAALLTSSWLERLMIIPSMTTRNANAETGQSDADALRAATGLLRHVARRSYVSLRQYASRWP